MFIWQHQTKMAPEGDGSSAAAGVMAVDPGAPLEISSEPEPKPAEPKKDDPIEARLRALEADNKTLRARNDELSASEREWAERALSANREPAEEVIRTAPAERTEVKTTPEQDLDEIAKIGLAEVMRKRGFVSRAELDEAVRETEERANQNLQAARTDATFDQQLATEFPEIKADHDRIAAGKKPESQLFVRTADIYRQAVREDPSLKDSKSTLLLAARTAKAQLDAEEARKPGGKKVEPAEDAEPTRQQRRRDRIDSQRSDRAAVGSEEADDTPSFTKQQLEVMARLKVPQADFIKNSRGAHGR